jgi:hypothetical protein
MKARLGGRSAAILLAATVLACAPAPSATAPTNATDGPTTGATGQVGSPPTGASPEPTAVDTGSAGTPPCLLADLKASHGLIEGAAGSRLTEVVLVAAETCSVDAFPAFRLRDASGAGLVGGTSAGPGAIDLVPGVAYTSEARVANWCAPEPAFPLALEIVLGEQELAVTGGSFPEEGDLPPCSGDGAPILEGTAWTPSS